MTLDSCPSDAELLRIAAERKAGKAPQSRQIAPQPTNAPAMTVRLPWSVLVADNAKYGVAGGRMILTAAYRTAKASARRVAEQQVEGRSPLTGRLAFVARVYEPNRSRTRDVVNLGKLVHDALSGVCYEDDGQLDDVRWIRAGVDVDAPRCEITISLRAP